MAHHISSSPRRDRYVDAGASIATSGSRLASGHHWRRWYMAGLAAISAYSTGVAWQAQAVSYPLYRSVTPESFTALATLVLTHQLARRPALLLTGD